MLRKTHPGRKRRQRSTLSLLHLQKLVVGVDIESARLLQNGDQLGHTPGRNDVTAVLDQQRLGFAAEPVGRKAVYDGSPLGRLLIGELMRRLRPAQNTTDRHN